MTPTSQAIVVGAVTAVSELTDLLQNDHWTHGGRPVCGDKSVPDDVVLYLVVSLQGFTVRHYLVYYGEWFISG